MVHFQVMSAQFCHPLIELFIHVCVKNYRLFNWKTHECLEHMITSPYERNSQREWQSLSTCWWFIWCAFFFIAPRRKIPVGNVTIVLFPISTAAGRQKKSSFYWDSSLSHHQSRCNHWTLLYKYLLHVCTSISIEMTVKLKSVDGMGWWYDCYPYPQVGIDYSESIVEWVIHSISSIDLFMALWLLLIPWIGFIIR